MEIQRQINHHLEFIDESSYGRLRLPTFRYKKIAELLNIDFDSLDKIQKTIFKSHCLSK
jgi:hypothetical protein